MLKTAKRLKATFALIGIWTVLLLLTGRYGLVEQFAGLGMKQIGHEYYRFFTGSLLHFNLFHLLINSIVLYWVGYYAEEGIGSVRFFIFGLVAAALAFLMYACILPNSGSCIGGSVVVFSYMGLIIALQFYKPDFPRFQRKARYGSWIIGYGIIGNMFFLSFIPFLSFLSFSTLVIHVCALGAGAVLGWLGIRFRLL